MYDDIQPQAHGWHAAGALQVVPCCAPRHSRFVKPSWRQACLDRPLSSISTQAIRSDTTALRVRSMLCTCLDRGCVASGGVRACGTGDPGTPPVQAAAPNWIQRLSFIIPDISWMCLVALSKGVSMTGLLLDVLCPRMCSFFRGSQTYEYRWDLPHTSWSSCSFCIGDRQF